MAHERLGGLFGAAALLGHRTARPKFSRAAEMVDGTKSQRPAPVAGPGLDQGRGARDGRRGTKGEIRNPKSETRTRKPGGGDREIFAGPGAAGSGGNSQRNPADPQTGRCERAHSLEHEKPDAQPRFGRRARTGSLYPTGARARITVARRDW